MNASLSTHDGTSPLTQALIVTQSMLLAAEAADWEELQRLQDQRELLLRRQHPADQASQAQLGQVLENDRQLQAILAAARDELLLQWQGDRGRIRAIAAYQQP